MHPAVEARQVTKRFPGVVANDAVDFTVNAGEVHALLGENGAGKSTLAAVLCGLYSPDEGELHIGGALVRLQSPRDGLNAGIGMVHQHFRLVEKFTVAENVVLGSPDLPLRLRRREIEERVGALSETFGLPVDPGALVADLSVGERQRIEIVKMLHRGADVLLLDEPTAVLTPQEVDALFENIETITAAGKSVVFISHKLHEVMAVSDRVTVMRNGRVTGEVATAETDQRSLAEMMVGRSVDLPSTRSQSVGDEALVVRDLSVTVARGMSLHDIDLVARRGEIVGVAGVAGNGQRELAEALSGILRPDSGSVTVDGVVISGAGPRRARDAGVAYVPDDRLGTGLVGSMSLVDNTLLTRRRSFFLDRRTGRRETEAAISEFGIKAPNADAKASLLSGGNAQKALLARELRPSDLPPPEVVIVASPTRGLDVGAIEFVRSLLDDVRSRGGGVILISEDLDEVRSMSDRIIVLYEGRIVLEGPTDDFDLHTIGLAMAGVGAV